MRKLTEEELQELEEEFSVCQNPNCGKKLDKENNEYHRKYGTCDQYCYEKMVL